MTDTLIIAVNYKAADATIRFLESASKMEQFRFAHVIVVENGSGDGSAETLRPKVARFDNVELFESEVNRGYFGAANWALRQYLGRDPKPDWVIVCNNDIVFDDCRFLSKLFQHNPEWVAVIAPTIVAGLTGADCNPFLADRPTPLQILRMRLWHSNYYFMWFKQLLSPHVRTLRHRLRSWSKKPRARTPRPIYAAHGSFFIFSRSFFEAGGYLDDGHFLYAEELCIAETCFRLGLRVVHESDLQVSHEGHQATGRLLDRAMYVYARDGLQYVMENYFSRDARCAGKSPQWNSGPM
jgi:GT2 family glycosyltransferase